MQYHGPREVCQQLRIADSTLRKWAGYLIKLGDYEFVVDQFGHRSYSDRDVAVLRRMQELLAQKYTYKEAVKKICNAENANNSENDGNADTISVLARTHVLDTQGLMQPEMYAQISSLLREQADLNRQLVERMERIEEREKQHEERLKERDQALLTTLKLLQEAARNEAAAAQEKKKRRWWSKSNPRDQ